MSHAAPALHPLNLTQQVAEFQAYVASGALTFDPDKTLFFLLGGLNEYARSSDAQIAAATRRQVQALDDAGGRYFEIGKLPTLIPEFVLSAEHVNPVMEALVPELALPFPSAIFKLSDWGSDHDEILTHPAKYGITNTTESCKSHFGPGATICARPEKYFYYDPDHPSDAAHRIVGRALLAEALAIPEPMTFEFSALGRLRCLCSRDAASAGVIFESGH